MADRFLRDYLSRIGYSGDTAPTIENIAAIHAHHTRAIPFENLTPAGGGIVDISAQGIEDVLVRRRRGGYCFQHSGLLSRALAELGAADVENHLGRVYWQREPGSGAPARTHQATLFTHDGERYLLDAGFGGFTPSGVLPLGTAETVTALGTFRFVAAAEAGLPEGDTAGTDLMLQAMVGGGWANLYGIDLRPSAPADLAVANWFTSTSDTPPFTRSLIFAILTEHGRVTLSNLVLSVRTYAQDGSSAVEKRTLSSAAELRDVARELFLIEDARVDWDRIYRVAAAA